MKLSSILKANKAKLFSNIEDSTLTKSCGEWFYQYNCSVSGNIGVGWLSNDDILLFGLDGIYIVDKDKGEIIFEDLENNVNDYISKDNVSFYVEHRNETVNIFGLRGGGGNLLTEDKRWELDVFPLSWNIKTPKISNIRTRSVYYPELTLLSYEGYLFVGFSSSNDYFLIMGDRGIEVYKRYPPN